jgi:broad specificity phosphatase PhoE
MCYLLPFISLLLFSCGNTIYIVRHAEKAKPLAGMMIHEANNPPLSDSGQLRAIRLRDELRNKNVKHIFSTPFRRTVSTAEPLNELLGTTSIERYSPHKDSTGLFIEKLKRIRDGNVLVVGHSNTIDDLANKLCGATVVPGDLKDNEYDNLFILKRKGNTYHFKNEKYGAPSK